jgi:hypothetical protein
MVLSLEEDEWKWRLEEDGKFSVSSTYNLLGLIFSPESLLGVHELRVLSIIWKCPAPSKVIAFSWKLFRNRIASRVNLMQRGIHVNGGDISCVHCQRGVEDSAHLFLFCDFAVKVWQAIFRWLGVVIVLPPNLPVLYDCFVASAKSKLGRVGFSLIWHASVWSLWKSRNNCIFSNGVVDYGEVVEAIKLASWRWGISRHKIPVCLYYEWCWDPGLCLRMR